eukprot:gene5883-11881_t
MLKSLSQLIETSTCELSIQELSTAFYGLQQMTGDSQEVRQLLSTLTDKLESSSSDVELTGVYVGMILYGLQGMSNQYDEVRNLLQILTLKIRCTRFEFKAQQSIGMALYGLQGMSSENEELKLLIKSLREKMNDMTSELDSQAVGNGLTASTMNSTNALLVSGPDLLNPYQSTALALRGLPGLDKELRGKLEVARDLLLDFLNERIVEVNNFESSP